MMFDTMAYRGLLKYQISLSLFIVSEPRKFQMSGFFIGIGENSSTKATVISWNSLKTRGPMGHILDTDIRCFRAVRVGISTAAQ